MKPNIVFLCLFYRLGVWFGYTYILASLYRAVIKCTENGFTNAFISTQKGDTEVMRDVKDMDEDIGKIKKDLSDEGAVSYIRFRKIKNEINMIEDDVHNLKNCCASNAYDINGIIQKIDEMDESIQKIKNNVSDFIDEAREIINKLDKEIRRQLL